MFSRYLFKMAPVDVISLFGGIDLYLFEISMFWLYRQYWGKCITYRFSGIGPSGSRFAPLTPMGSTEPSASVPTGPDSANIVKLQTFDASKIRQTCLPINLKIVIVILEHILYPPESLLSESISRFN